MQMPSPNLHGPGGRKNGGKLPPDLAGFQAVLEALFRVLSDMADSMDTIAMYCEKKGLKEELYTEEELEEAKGEEDEPGIPGVPGN